MHRQTVAALHRARRARTALVETAITSAGRARQATVAGHPDAALPATDERTIVTVRSTQPRTLQRPVWGLYGCEACRPHRRRSLMSIAPKLHQYRAARNVQFDVITHEPTLSSTRTAEASRVSGDSLAKGIVLRRGSRYLLAVLPASHHIRLSDLRSQLGDNVEIAEETEVGRLFPDCAHGAVPPVGQCYGLPLIVD